MESAICDYSSFDRIAHFQEEQVGRGGEVRKIASGLKPINLRYKSPRNSIIFFFLPTAPFKMFLERNSSTNSPKLNGPCFHIFHIR